MKHLFKIVLLISLFVPTLLFSQAEKVRNTPYIDQRRIHFGFMLGMHTQDIAFTHSGYVEENGEAWFAEIPDFSPGFTVGLVADLAFTENLNLRFTPNMYFGNKNVFFREQESRERVSQDIKSNYLNFPISIKYSAWRVNNYRPYLTGGFTGSFDLSKRKDTPLVLNRFDVLAEVGLGCDIYLPFFKLIPELRFGFGLLDIIKHDRPDVRDLDNLKYTRSISKGVARTVSLIFYFE